LGWCRPRDASENLLDTKRTRLLESPEALRRFAAGGTAWRFENTGRHVQTLVELAVDAIELASPDARKHWLAVADWLPGYRTESLTRRLGCMSEPERTFADRLLQTNAERIRDECRRRT
jgi:hypothetical protein